MTELVFEILGGINFLIGSYCWGADHDDIMHWLFFLVCSAIMYINAIRYGKGDE